MATDSVVVDVSEDWAIACDVQRRFMQHARPATNALSYSARCRQARAVGGDFYDVLPLSHNRLGLAIGDAAGKSIGAALMILGVQSTLRTAASFAGDNPAIVLRTVNSHLHGAFLESRFATLFYGIFDGNTRMLRYVNAGHNPPLVIRRDGSVLPLETGGLPVGIFPDSDYEEGVVELRPGDLVVAYTDGITESVNSAGEEWGLNGLRTAIDQTAFEHPDEIAQSIFGSMDEFSRDRQADDATVLVARVH